MSGMLWRVLFGFIVVVAVLAARPLGAAFVWLAGLAFRRPRCPRCEARALCCVGGMRAHGVDEQGRRVGMSWSEYLCETCGERFRQTHGKALVPIAMWEAGNRDGIPTATVRR